MALTSTRTIPKKKKKKGGAAKPTPIAKKAAPPPRKKNTRSKFCGLYPSPRHFLQPPLFQKMDSIPFPGDVLTVILSYLSIHAAARLELVNKACVEEEIAKRHLDRVIVLIRSNYYQICRWINELLHVSCGVPIKQFILRFGKGCPLLPQSPSQVICNETVRHRLSQCVAIGVSGAVTVGWIREIFRRVLWNPQKVEYIEFPQLPTSVTEAAFRLSAPSAITHLILPFHDRRFDISKLLSFIDQCPSLRVVYWNNSAFSPDQEIKSLAKTAIEILERSKSTKFLFAQFWGDLGLHDDPWYWLKMNCHMPENHLYEPSPAERYAMLNISVEEEEEDDDEDDEEELEEEEEDDDDLIPGWESHLLLGMWKLIHTKGLSHLYHRIVVSTSALAVLADGAPWTEFRVCVESLLDSNSLEFDIEEFCTDYSYRGSVAIVPVNLLIYSKYPPPAFHPRLSDIWCMAEYMQTVERAKAAAVYHSRIPAEVDPLCYTIAREILLAEGAYLAAMGGDMYNTITDSDSARIVAQGLWEKVSFCPELVLLRMPWDRHWFDQYPVHHTDMVNMTCGIHECPVYSCIIRGLVFHCFRKDTLRVGDSSSQTEFLHFLNMILLELTDFREEVLHKILLSVGNLPALLWILSTQYDRLSNCYDKDMFLKILQTIFTPSMLRTPLMWVDAQFEFSAMLLHYSPPSMNGPRRRPVAKRAEVMRKFLPLLDSRPSGSISSATESVKWCLDDTVYLASFGPQVLYTNKYCVGRSNVFTRIQNIVGDGITLANDKVAAVFQEEGDAEVPSAVIDFYEWLISKEFSVTTSFRNLMAANQSLHNIPYHLRPPYPL